MDVIRRLRGFNKLKSSLQDIDNIPQMAKDRCDEEQLEQLRSIFTELLSRNKKECFIDTQTIAVQFFQGDIQMAQLVFNAFDTHRDGKISMREFFIGCCILMHGNKKEKSDFLFRLLNCGQSNEEITIKLLRESLAIIVEYLFKKHASFAILQLINQIKVISPTIESVINKKQFEDWYQTSYELHFVIDQLIESISIEKKEQVLSTSGKLQFTDLPSEIQQLLLKACEKIELDVGSSVTNQKSPQIDTQSSYLSFVQNDLDLIKFELSVLGESIEDLIDLTDDLEQEKILEFEWSVIDEKRKIELINILHNSIISFQFSVFRSLLSDH